MLHADRGSKKGIFLGARSRWYAKRFNKNNDAKSGNLSSLRKYGGSMRVVFAFLVDTTQAGSLNRPEWSYACVSVLHASNLSNASN